MGQHDDCSQRDADVEPATEGERFEQVLRRAISRRQLIHGAGLGLLGVAGAGLFSGCSGTGSERPAPGIAGTSTATGAKSGKLGFQSVPISTADTVVVPPGYGVRVLHAWGDPISDGPAFRHDAGNTAQEQMQQVGMHHDGMHFFPLPRGSDQSDHGLLVLNHEYVDAALLHPDGGYRHAPESFSLDKAHKEMAAHGVSVLEVRRDDTGWQLVRPSRLARRITALTPIDIGGPAAGHPLLHTREDPEGRRIVGTINNCAHGWTPWGTYLTCEENFAGYFRVPENYQPTNEPRHRRYKLGNAGVHGYYGWGNVIDRFDLSREPNEPHRYGWVVEIDPFDPDSVPVKRTALGRFAHESATCVLGDDGRLAVYSGDDDRFEYIYKFVASGHFDAANPAAARDLLDDGILYAARFNDDGSGEWLPLVHGQDGLDAEHGFADQGEVLVFARMAAERLGATRMDRPEWIACHPRTREMYATLTNNVRRGDDDTDGPNPRPRNLFGHVLRWNEDDGNPTATRFRWDILALAGDGSSDEDDRAGTINGDIYANPDGLWMDRREVLWIQTDVSETVMRLGPFAPFGNNMMMACDPDTGETRRFLTGPIGCEVTGMSMTPDLRTFFVNIQHPGDVPADLALRGVRVTPETPNAASSWPDGPDGGRPRSATIVITRDDGDIIGA